MQIEGRLLLGVSVIYQSMVFNHLWKTIDSNKETILLAHLNKTLSSIGNENKHNLGYIKVSLLKIIG